MITNLPRCTCGTHPDHWKLGGGEFRTTSSTQYMTCTGCGHNGLRYTIYGWHLLFLYHDALTDQLSDYLNTTIMIQSRAYKAEVEQAQKARLASMPAEAVVEVNIKSDLVAPPDPLNLPPGIFAYVLRLSSGELVWQSVPDSVGHSSLPPDPLRESWVAYFTQVREQVGEQLGLPIPEFTEIRNQYHRDMAKAEPWYSFKLGAGTITMGPRKHVVSIEARYYTPRDVSKLKAIADADNVTFVADGQVTATPAVIVHAWTQAKVVECLTLLLEQAANPWVDTTETIGVLGLGIGAAIALSGMKNTKGVDRFVQMVDLDKLSDFGLVVLYQVVKQMEASGGPLMEDRRVTMAVLEKVMAERAAIKAEAP